MTSLVVRCAFIAFTLMVASSTLSPADLKRARTRRPRNAYRGTTYYNMNVQLNDHLRTTPRRLHTLSNRVDSQSGSRRVDFFLPCDGVHWSAQSMGDVLRTLHTHRSEELRQAYLESGDRRSLIHASFTELEARLFEDDVVLMRMSEQRSWSTKDLAQQLLFEGLVRDSRCRLAVMWWAHHLSAYSRQSLLQDPKFSLPLLPTTEFEFEEQSGTLSLRGDGRSVRAVMSKTSQQNKSVIAMAFARYQDGNVCTVCHYFPNQPPSPPWPNATKPMKPFPMNVNFSIYAGDSTCCGPTTNNIYNSNASKAGGNWSKVGSGYTGFTMIRDIDRRLDSNPPQQLEINSFCDDGQHRDTEGNVSKDNTCCIRDDCPKDRFRQYESCNLFYNGSALWEWHPKVRKCIKLVEGVGSPWSDWFLRSGVSNPTSQVDEIWEPTWRPAASSSGTASNVNHSMGSYHSCARFEGAPAGGPTQHLWLNTDGSPCRHHQYKGIDVYGNYRPTPELARKLIYEAGHLPNYCPSWDSQPYFANPYMLIQLWPCTGCWWKASGCPTATDDIVRLGDSRTHPAALANNGEPSHSAQYL